MPPIPHTHHLRVGKARMTTMPKPILSDPRRRFSNVSQTDKVADLFDLEYRASPKEERVCVLCAREERCVGHCHRYFSDNMHDHETDIKVLLPPTYASSHLMVTVYLDWNAFIYQRRQRWTILMAWLITQVCGFPTFPSSSTANGGYGYIGYVPFSVHWPPWRKRVSGITSRKR